MLIKLKVDGSRGKETIKNTQLALLKEKKYVKYLLNLWPFYRKKL